MNGRKLFWYANLPSSSVCGEGRFKPRRGVGAGGPNLSSKRPRRLASLVLAAALSLRPAPNCVFEVQVLFYAALALLARPPLPLWAVVLQMPLCCNRYRVLFLVF